MFKFHRRKGCNTRTNGANILKNDAHSFAIYTVLNKIKPKRSFNLHNLLNARYTIYFARYYVHLFTHRAPLVF